MIVPVSLTQLPFSIRPERADDAKAISEVTRDAFRSHPRSNHAEEFIIEALRKEDALAVSLIAEIHGEVVGHVACSRIEISDGSRQWYALGPLSVKPLHQGKGIGRALVEKAIAALQRLGGLGCVLVGDAAFYGRFGFQAKPGLRSDGIPKEYFLALPFGEEVPSGTVTCHAAFYAKY